MPVDALRLFDMGVVDMDADLFFSFRSPYSYLAIMRWRALVRQFDLTLHARPVYPLAIRQPDFFERNHPNWLRYTAIDVARLAQSSGVTIVPPRPDPIVQDIATRRIAEDQPHIFSLVRMGQVAARRGRGFAFAAEVMPLIWGGTENWNEGDHLGAAAARAGIDIADLRRKAEEDADALDGEIAANQAALEQAGHWGVPTLVFDGEPFFGQDRIDLALWRMEQNGLQRI